MSKLLIDDKPVMVLPKLATAIGLNDAIVLQQIHYWLTTYKNANKSGHFRGGKWWVYNTKEEWTSNFPWWSESTVWRSLTSLRKHGLIEVSNKYNKRGYDRTLWYTIDYEALEQLEMGILSNWQNGFTQGDKMDDLNLTSPIPETTTETIQKITTETDCDFLDLPPTDNPLSESNSPTERGNGNNLPQGDLLDCITHFSEQSEREKRPKGWQDTGEAVFGICQHVARLWFAGRIPTGTWGDRIEKWCAGATELLSYHDGDIQATRATLDRYHAHYVENEMTLALAGPHSLINVVSQFMAQNDAGKGGQKVLRIGR